MRITAIILYTGNMEWKSLLMMKETRWVLKLLVPSHWLQSIPIEQLPSNVDNPINVSTSIALNFIIIVKSKKEKSAPSASQDWLNIISFYIASETILFYHFTPRTNPCKMFFQYVSHERQLIPTFQIFLQVVKPFAHYIIYILELTLSFTIALLLPHYCPCPRKIMCISPGRP